MMITSERLFDYISRIIVGVLMAGLLALFTHWVWPEMWLAVFIAFLVYWGFGAVDTLLAERHGVVRTSKYGWRSVTHSDIRTLILVRAFGAMSLRSF